MHLLHFLSSFYYQAQEIASVFFSLIKKWKSISPFFPPSPFFFFISFMPRIVWWTSFAYVKLYRSILLSAAWIFVLDALWWVCTFWVFVCARCCLIMCATAFSHHCVCLSIFLCVLSDVCHVWPVSGSASGTHLTTPAATWTIALWAQTSSSIARFVISRVKTSPAGQRLLSLIVCLGLLLEKFSKTDLIIAGDAMHERCKILLKINKVWNPYISCHHLAWQML